MEIKVRIVNFFGSVVKDFSIQIISCSSLFEGKSKLLREENFKDNKEKDCKFKKNQNGIIKVNSTRGIYEIENNDSKEKYKIRLPLFKKDIKLSDIQIDDLSEKYRWDKDKCYLCKKKYKNSLDIFRCKYCKKIFCEVHRIPENHKCGGNPVLPYYMRQSFESWTFSKG